MVPEAGLGSKFSAGAVLGALSGLLASPFDLVRIRPLGSDADLRGSTEVLLLAPCESLSARVQAEAGRCDSGMLTTGLCAGQPQRIRGTASCRMLTGFATQHSTSAFEILCSARHVLQASFGMKSGDKNVSVCATRRGVGFQSRVEQRCPQHLQRLGHQRRPELRWNARPCRAMLMSLRLVPRAPKVRSVCMTVGTVPVYEQLGVDSDVSMSIDTALHMSAADPKKDWVTRPLSSSKAWQGFACATRTMAEVSLGLEGGCYPEVPQTVQKS